MTEELGKIVSIDIAEEDGKIMLKTHLTMESGDTNLMLPWSWSKEVGITERTKWTEKDRDDGHLAIIYRVSELVRDAKVSSLKNLTGKPIMAQIENRTVVDFRILTEVIQWFRELATNRGTGLQVSPN